MFATVLKEITGYFDRRALLSTFFPTLIAAAALLTAVALAFFDVRAWSALSGLVQALLIAGFLIVVAVASFVTLNLRPLLDQALQGRWGRAGLAGRLARRYEAERASAVREDERLERLESLLIDAEAAMPRHDRRAAPFTGDVPQELAALEQGWDGAAALPAEDLPPLAARLSALGATHHHEVETPRFARLVGTAKRALQRRLQEVRFARAAVHQRLFVLYPDEPLAVAPTRIGNIMLAAEQHPRLRYGLDPAVIWTRLQPLLPEPFSVALRDAKASLDLMLTLSIHLPAAGLPIAALTAVVIPFGTGVAAWTSLAAALVVVGGLFRVRWFLAVPMLALVPVAPVVLFGVDPDPRGWAGVLVRVAFGVSVAGAVVVMTRLLLAGAREAALAFCDQLKAAFDLYRLLVIRELGLESPADLETERGLWLDICDFLYRGDEPASPAFRYARES